MDKTTAMAAEIYVHLAELVGQGKITFSESVVILMHATARIVGCIPDRGNRQKTTESLVETMRAAIETYALLTHEPDGTA